MSDDPPLDDSIRVLVASVTQSSARQNSVFTSDLKEAEQLIAVLESYGDRQAEAEVQPGGQELVSWRRE
jgi:hypothetical protein